MVLLYVDLCIAFIEYIIAVKPLLDYTNSFPPNDYKNNHKIVYMYFKDKYAKTKRKQLLEKKKKNEVDETRNYPLIEENNDLMSQSSKKVCRVSDYFEHFLPFISAVSSGVSISSFVSLVGVPVGICIRIAYFALGLNIFCSE